MCVLVGDHAWINTIMNMYAQLEKWSVELRFTRPPNTPLCPSCLVCNKIALIKTKNMFDTY